MGSLFVDESVIKFPLVVLAALCIVPVFLYGYVMTIWHWKDRYRGRHSHLWGALLILETTGWFKIIYWFRHIIPDWNGRGRYARSYSELEETENARG